MPAVSKSAVIAALLLCCALAVALKYRLYQLSTGLGQDELFTAVNYVELDSILGTISHNEVFNNHIGYSLMARFSEAIWGRSEWALRLPALLCGLLGLCAAFVLTRSILGEKLALLAALLLALSPPHIAASVSARGYTAMILLTTVSGYLYLQLLKSPNRGSAVLFVAVSALGIYTHLYSGAVTAVQVLFLGYLGLPRRNTERLPLFKDRAHVRLLAVSFLAVFMLVLGLYAPAARSMLHGLMGRGRSAFDPGFPWAVAKHLAGSEQVPVVVLMILVAVVGWLSRRQSHRLAASYFAWLLVVPLAVMWLLVRPFDLYPRFFIYWLPYYLILFLAGLRALWHLATLSRLAAVAAPLGTGAVLAVVLSGWLMAARVPIPDEGYREASRIVLADAEPSAAICAIGGARSVWKYYIKEPILLPRSVAELEAIAETHPEVRCAYFKAEWQSQEQTALARFLFEHSTSFRINDELTVFVYQESRQRAMRRPQMPM